MKKRIIILLLAAAVLLWILWGNTALELNTYTIVSRKLPEAFSGFRIAHISDLHNARIGTENQKLLQLLTEAAPDMIVITGDFVDSRKTNLAVAADFAAAAAAMAPCYYVTGNHEARLSGDVYSELEAALTQAGVTILHNETVAFRREAAEILITGLDDPSFGGYTGIFASLPGAGGQVPAADDTEGYQILLSHRPELFRQYVQAGFDLVFSGHAHGGQFRLPWLGGVIAPNQGLFPEYDGGLYTDGSTNMLLSRGIGNSIFPFRVNNRPEVILAVLEHASGN